MKRNALKISKARSLAGLAAPVLLALLSVGCAMSERYATTPGLIHPALEATQAQLTSAYQAQARAVQSLSATVVMSPTAGSTYSGVIQQYHDVGGFILANRPAMIRVIGQAPVVSTDIFDMVSDSESFRIFIPSKNKFLVGSTSLDRPTKNPIENLRPQHILDALFWPELRDDAPILFEESDTAITRSYVLILTRPRAPGEGIEIDRKVWFDRSNLRVSRMEIYGPGGRLDADIAYSSWQPTTDPAAGQAGAQVTTANATPAGMLFPREIKVTRPQQDYQLSVSITKLALNTDIPEDRFALAQPTGTELVNLRDGEPGRPQP
jgi:outer membrane lipoprotein-sorting protein